MDLPCVYQSSVRPVLVLPPAAFISLSERSLRVKQSSICTPPTLTGDASLAGKCISSSVLVQPVCFFGCLVSLSQPTNMLSLKRLLSLNKRTCYKGPSHKFLPRLGFGFNLSHQHGPFGNKDTHQILFNTLYLSHRLLKTPQSNHGR